MMVNNNSDYLIASSSNDENTLIGIVTQQTLAKAMLGLLKG